MLTSRPQKPLKYVKVMIKQQLSKAETIVKYIFEDVIYKLLADIRSFPEKSSSFSTRGKFLADLRTDSKTI